MSEPTRDPATEIQDKEMERQEKEAWGDGGCQISKEVADAMVEPEKD